MNLVRKQKGMSLIGMLIFMSFVGFFIYAGIRLGPIYSEYHSVVKAMELVAKKPGAVNMSPSALQEEIAKGFYASYVERVKPKDVKVLRSRGKKLQLKYEVREPFIANLDFLVHFEKTIPLSN